MQSAETVSVLGKGGSIRYPWGRQAEILVVEDDDGSYLLMQLGFSASQIAHRLSRVRDGEEALAFLRQLEPYSQAPRPDLIFLDLHMPNKDGREFLREAKTDMLFKRIPVIMLTSSSDQNDINSVYDLHANCYLPKSKNLNELSEQIRLIEQFWFGIVLWPTASPVRAASAKQQS